MNKTLTVLLIIISSVFALGVVAYFMYDNKYLALETDYEEQINDDKLDHDNMFKILKKQAGVTQNYSDSFKENYTAIMSSRNYGGELMKWITESNPNFTPEMHQQLMNSIEIYQNKFKNSQTKLISIHKEMSKLLKLFPSKFFLVTIGGHELPELKIVTNSSTEHSFETGKDDDIDLFPKKDTTKN